MVNRVVLDADGLRVSKPGVNVLTAGRRNLMFDSDAAGLEFHSRGTINPPDNILKDNTKTYTYNYGHDFGYVPLIFLQIRWYSHSYVYISPWTSYYMLRDGHGGSLRITCGSSQFTVRHKAGDETFIFNYKFHYAIYKYPLS